MAIFACDAVYGYDWERTQADFTPGKPLNPANQKVAVASERGWQNSGIKVERGKSYKITASGKVELARTSQPWLSEANGITLRYHHGRPLGMLLAAINGEQPKKKSNVDNKDDDEEIETEAFISLDKAKRKTFNLVQFNDPFKVRNEATLTAPRSGTLFFKVNDSAAELADNKGSYEVTVEVIEK